LAVTSVYLARGARNGLGRTEQILASVDPGNPEDPVSWPGWAQLLPHILAATME